MGHTQSQDLVDLKSELAIISKYENVVQKSPGIFYYKSTAFLHFHDKDGKRWADLKVDQSWKKIEIDFKSTKSSRLAFLKAVQNAHLKLQGKK